MSVNPVRPLLSVFAGLLAGLAVVVFQLLDPGGAARQQREAGFDALMAVLSTATPTGDVMVVDIDRASLARHGSWPWPRETVADLVEAIAAGVPRALAIDVVFSERVGEDARQQAATARLAAAISKIPAVLGIALDTDGGDGQLPPAPPVLLPVGEVPDRALALPRAAGLAVPAPALVGAARGVGLLSLVTEDGAPVRDTPLLAQAAGGLWTSLAVEAVRVADGESPVYWESGRGEMLIAGRRMAAPDEGRMRLFPATQQRWRDRTLSATTLMDNPGQRSALAGKVVFLGSSAPEAGGLRATPWEPFAPSVQLHADAAAQLLAGRQPLRREALVWPESVVALIIVGAAVAAALLLAPGLGVAAFVALVLLAFGASALIFRLSDLLLDAAFPALAGTAAFLGASLMRLGGEWLARQAMERRFAQHLAPEIVARIVADPSVLKLSGERREITALFTDIEGFTAMTEDAEPEDLVALLDRYIELVCAAVRAQSGMVDKVVGDAVHAYFNAPVDLADHADRALDAALEIIRLTEDFRKDPLAARLGLGRTRIGIESGRVIVGDIGGATKLDYTAHGPAVNLAARLEAFCKGRPEAIAIGPGAVALLSPQRRLRQLGILRASAASPEIVVMTPDV